MKQLFFVTLVLFLLGMAPSAHAAELRLGTANILQNGTAVINLSIAGGSEPYAGVNAKILLPKSISVTGVGRGELLSSGSFTSDYQTSWDSTNNIVTVIAYSGTSAFTAPASGTLLTLNLKADSAASAGAFTVQFANTNAAPINSGYALAKADGSVSVIPSPIAGTVTVQADADTDSLGDSWETRYFGNLTSQTGSGDYDKDGFTNKQEYENGTNPAVKDAFSLADVITVLKVNAGISVSAATLDVSQNGKTGTEDAVYILQKIAGKR